MEIPVVQYEIADIFNGFVPSICPKCLNRSLTKVDGDFCVEDFFCQKCLENNDNVGLEQDTHWEAKGVVTPIKSLGIRTKLKLSDIKKNLSEWHQWAKSSLPSYCSACSMAESITSINEPSFVAVIMALSSCGYEIETD